MYIGNNDKTVHYEQEKLPIFVSNNGIFNFPGAEESDKFPLSCFCCAINYYNVADSAQNRKGTSQ